MVNILDESLYAFANFAFSNFFSLRFTPIEFVAGERFTEHCNQWPISRKKYCMCWFITLAPLGGDIQTNQRFTSSGDACDKTDDFTPEFTRLIYQLLDAMRSNS